MYVHGAWAVNAAPVEDEDARLAFGHGIIAIYLNLPGGHSGERDSPGEDDQRGPQARQAVGAALRYAAGEAEDTGGCRLPQRLAGPLSPEIALAGFSNGGNLAWAALSDPDVDAPPVAGVATFETPANGQMVLAEMGKIEDPSPVYYEGSCGLGADGAVVCGYPYPGLAFDAGGGEAGVLFLDADGDGSFGADDYPIHAVWSPEDEAWVHSLQAREAAAAAGIALPNRASVEQTDRFWAWREAPRRAPAALARFPGLASVVVGTEVDHVLTGATDHPHVSGLAAALLAAGARWVRVNPDSAYSTLASGAPDAFPEQPANAPVDVGGDVTLLPYGDAAGGREYLTAAVLELLDRAHDGEWATDLPSALHW